MAWRPAFFSARHVTRSLRYTQIRHNTSSIPPAPEVATSSPTPGASTSKGIHPDELEKLLAEPTWSVESLLPPTTRAPDAPEITSKQLHHLLRLSALPPPSSAEEEQKMLETLRAQLHFVGKIQEVDTTGITPLRAIRDETTAAEREQTVTVRKVRGALNREKIVGFHYKRIRRQPMHMSANHAENWDVLGSAERKSGRYFVVESERPQE